jgi:lipopolysaccharide transport protein LptA
VTHGTRRSLATFAWLLAAFQVCPALPVRPSHAADVVIGSEAGDVISEIASATRQLRLASVPADMFVESDRMVFDYQRGELSYYGDVRVAQGGIRLRSDDLTIAFEPEQTGSLRSIRASGNVLVTHKNTKATGKLAVYDPNSSTITLTGDARLGAGPNSLEGERVVVYLAEGRATVEGGSAVAEHSPRSRPEGAVEEGQPAPTPSGRVRAVIDPGSLGSEDFVD